MTGHLAIGVSLDGAVRLREVAARARAGKAADRDVLVMARKFVERQIGDLYSVRVVLYPPDKTDTTKGLAPSDEPSS